MIYIYNIHRQCPPDETLRLSRPETTRPESFVWRFQVLGVNTE